MFGFTWHYITLLWRFTKYSTDRQLGWCLFVGVDRLKDRANDRIKTIDITYNSFANWPHDTVQHYMYVAPHELIRGVQV
jgi:hypothetical protein